MKRALLITTSILSFALYKYALASDCPEGQVLGVNTKTCIQSTYSCGSGCTYTIDETGTLTVNSSGSIGYSTSGGADVNKVVINNSTDTITYFNIGVLMGKPNLTEVVLPDNIQTLHGSTSELIENSGFTQFVLPETVTNIINSAGGLYSSNRITTYCTQSQIDGGLCRDSVTRYERDENNNLVVYNSDNTIKGVYADYTGITRDSVVDSYEKTDAVTGMIKKYSGRGELINSTFKAADGSVYKYDAQGNITGIKKKGTLTPAEAAAVARDGNDNVVSITW